MRANFRRRPAGKKAPKRRAPKRRTGGKKSGLHPTAQYAHIVETVEFTDIKSDVPYQTTFNLAQFFRATTVAKNFQYYRAKTVKWEYCPLYNTFQQNNAGAVVAKPQMYFMMNRDQDPYWGTRPAVDALLAIQMAGADPRPFTNNKEIIYKPNWCSPGLTAYGINNSNLCVNTIVNLGLKKQFGWLPTPNADAYTRPDRANLVENPVAAFGYTAANILNGGVIYNGHNLYIEQENEPDVPVAKLVCTVEWEFKLGKQNYAQPYVPPKDETTEKEPIILNT